MKVTANEPKNQAALPTSSSTAAAAAKASPTATMCRPAAKIGWAESGWIGGALCRQQLARAGDRAEKQESSAKAASAPATKTKASKAGHPAQADQIGARGPDRDRVAVGNDGRAQSLVEGLVLAMGAAANTPGSSGPAGSDSPFFCSIGHPN